VRREPQQSHSLTLSHAQKEHANKLRKRKEEIFTHTDSLRYERRKRGRRRRERLVGTESLSTLSHAQKEQEKASSEEERKKGH
jgi:hypothetical protein